jgi:phosphomannomutase
MRAVGIAKQVAKSRSGNAMIVNDGDADRTMRMPALIAG